MLILGGTSYVNRTRGVILIDIVKVLCYSLREKSPVCERTPHELNLGVNKLFIWFIIFMCVNLGPGSRFLGRFSAVELGDDLGIDPIELLFREDAKERPC